MALVWVLAGCAGSSGPGKPIQPAVSAGVLAVTHASIAAPINNLARISVPDAALLMGARLNGELAFCTTSPAYYASYDKPRGICLLDPGNTGRFDKFRIDGIARQFTLATPVPYTVENAANLSAAAVAACNDVAFAAWIRDPNLRSTARTHCLQDAMHHRQ